MIPSITDHRRLVLVTGAGGFLGRHVTTALRKSGFAVRSLMGPPAEAPSSLGTQHNPDEVWADICDRVALGEAVGGADVVVHLAGPPSVAGSFADPTAYVRIHIAGTVSLLEACRCQAKPPRVVVMSSAEVYGRAETEFVDEEQPVRPRSPYAAAKVGVEAMAAAYATSYGLAVIVLRPFSIYGPGMSPHTLLSEVAEKVLRGESVVVHDLQPIRDLCFVSDLASAVVCACTVPVSAPMTCNIGTMQGTSVAELCRLWLEALGSTGIAREDPIRRRPGVSEIYRLVSDNRRAREVLGWSPAVQLRTGLEITARSLRS